MRWLEIPAHRVLEVECNELNEFDIYDEAGKPCSGGRAYLLFCLILKSLDRETKPYPWVVMAAISSSAKRNTARETDERPGRINNFVLDRGSSALM